MAPHERRELELLERIQRLEENVKKEKRDECTYLQSNRGPLSQRIQDAPINRKLRMPQETYNGKGDPWNFLDGYTTNLANQRALDEDLCRMFLGAMKDQAREWYHSLPRGSINSYASLQEHFYAEFRREKNRYIDTACLKKIVREDRESLREYYTKFDACVKKIQNPEISCIKSYFNGGCGDEVVAKIVFVQKPADLLTFQNLVLDQCEVEKNLEMARVKSRKDGRY